MEQNLYNELVGEILGGESHARALAKKLGTNHMTVARKLKELVAENVLDSRIVGRNKVYFIRRTLEAKNRAVMAELHRLNKALERYPSLRNIAERVRGDGRIRLAILFGSHASGTATGRSDIDLFVETGDRALKRELELLNSRLSVKIGAYDRGSGLVREIEKNHVIFKGAELYHEKSGVFG